MWVVLTFLPCLIACGLISRKPPQLSMWKLQTLVRRLSPPRCLSPHLKWTWMQRNAVYPDFKKWFEINWSILDDHTCGKGQCKAQSWAPPPGEGQVSRMDSHGVAWMFLAFTFRLIRSYDIWSYACMFYKNLILWLNQKLSTTDRWQRSGASIIGGRREVFPF